MQHFRTLNGEPPNGGLPPGTVFYTVPASAPPFSALPLGYYIHTYYAHTDPRGWLPPQQEPPSPPPPPSPSASAPSQWTPPGAELFGQPAPRFEEAVHYLYPKDHTVFHVIWDRHMQLGPNSRPEFAAKMFPTGLTVRELIQRLGAPDDDDAKYGVKEIHELGDGRWVAGQTILLDSPRAAKTLREVGWDERRGTSTKPVWLQVHTE